MCEITAEHISRCKEAMSKPAPIQALRLIASGRASIEVTASGDVLMDRFDGKRVRDPDHPDCKMGLAGAWPLLHAGMIDRFGVVTDAGRALLAQEADRHG
ncbi:hypothetical protein [Methylorubrum extorquens]